MKILAKTITDQLTDERFLFDGDDIEFNYCKASIVSDLYKDIENEVKQGAIISERVFNDLENYCMLKFHFSKHYPNKVTQLI